MNDNEFWFSVIMVIGSLMLVKIIITAVMAGIRAYHDNSQFWGRNPQGIPPMFQKMTDKAMADRDELIDSLRERIEVLEKIVTDQHRESKSRNLSDEIDRLNR